MTESKKPRGRPVEHKLPDPIPDTPENNKPKRKPYKKGLKADYRGAKPEQVAKALHRHRPEQVEKRDAGKPPDKSS